MSLAEEIDAFCRKSNEDAIIEHMAREAGRKARNEYLRHHPPSWLRFLAKPGIAPEPQDDAFNAAYYQEKNRLEALRDVKD